MDQDKIIEITTIEQIIEMASMSSGNVSVSAQKEENMEEDKESLEEKQLRKYIRRKMFDAIIKENLNDYNLRMFVRNLMIEGDLSDTHPHRSTGINTLEDVLKKSIPTLRVDYKKLTTDKKQRDSFRAHVVKAILDALRPEKVNASYLQGTETGGDSVLLSEPTGGLLEEEDEDLMEIDQELIDLEEAEIQVDVGGKASEEDEGKKIPVEDDDEISPEEEFGMGLEGMDETGRNHAYTSYRKISQYVLDAYDSLANPKDKEVFLDYLVTNMKLYFDKFEDELQKTVEEPTTPEYEEIKGSA
jgi:hypothetical protein